MTGDGLRRYSGESAELPTEVEEVSSSSFLMLVAKSGIRAGMSANRVHGFERFKALGSFW